MFSLLRLAPPATRFAPEAAAAAERRRRAEKWEAERRRQAEKRAAARRRRAEKRAAAARRASEKPRRAAANPERNSRRLCLRCLSSVSSSFFPFFYRALNSFAITLFSLATAMSVICWARESAAYIGTYKGAMRAALRNTETAFSVSCACRHAAASEK